MPPPPSPQQISAQERVRALVAQVDVLIDLLREQQAALRQQGVRPSLDALDSLYGLKVRFSRLSHRLGEAIMELSRLRALAGTTSLINARLETDAVLEQVMDVVIRLTGAERGYIVLRNRETGELDQFRVARGMDSAALARGTAGPRPSDNAYIVSRTVVNEVAQTGQPVLTENASQDYRYRDQESIVGYALRSILAVPLNVRDEMIGVVYCDNRALAGLFQEQDRDLLAAFADQAAVAIENAQLFESARQRLEEITEMRDLMDNIFDSIASGVLTLDADGIVTTCNEAACRILGNDTPLGRRYDAVLPPLDEPFAATLNQVRDDGQQRVMRLEPYLHGLGRRDWTVIVSALRDAEGSHTGVALVLDDLTERRARESQLAELRHYLPSALVEHYRSVSDVSMGGQEREITVITADVRGFTSFSETLEPEVLMETINKYLSVASDAINLHEGIVDKYRGDAVVGLFNTQLNPQPDHAARAVRTARRIVEGLAALHATLPVDRQLFYGIGIHTGSAFLGNVGTSERREFAAVGEAMSVSKYLESQASPGEILISDATYQQVRDEVHCVRHSLGGGRPQALKRAYQVVGALNGD